MIIRRLISGGISAVRSPPQSRSDFPPPPYPPSLPPRAARANPKQSQLLAFDDGLGHGPIQVTGEFDSGPRLSRPTSHGSPVASLRLGLIAVRCSGDTRRRAKPQK
jgi:hypothetical protein